MRKQEGVDMGWAMGSIGLSGSSPPPEWALRSAK
jgi:hypothetical protein